MRLWHVDLIEYLPNSQLVAQWRELNSIFKKQDKHILINYIYEYKNKSVLYHYTQKVIDELKARHYNIRSFENMKNYFKGCVISNSAPDFLEHDFDYLTICYYNLKEKYIRGQKDFTNSCWTKLERFYKNTKLEEMRNE